MKLVAIALVALSGTLVLASPVNTVAEHSGAGNLLQGARAAAGGDAQRVAAGTSCIPPFCPWSNLPGGEGSSGTGESADFFVKDVEKMDELPNYQNKNSPNQCHPKCRWTCGTSSCNSLCTPQCKAPKCVTACKKISLARCKRVCKDPQCAVVCPPQCEHGNCPKCKTVCGASLCELNCGKSQCESTCGDPDCVWDCKPNPACAKPTCKMTCDNSVCSFGKDQKLPNNNEVPYMGQEIAWKGLGKIPEQNLGQFAPKTFSMPKLLGGAKLMGGAEKTAILIATHKDLLKEVDVSAHAR